MIIYTFSEARQKFTSVLEKARSEGKVLNELPRSRAARYQNEFLSY